MVSDMDHAVSEELPIIRDHFDNQLAQIRLLVEASNSRQEANHLAIVAEIARIGRDITEVKSDVKAQNGRVGKLEVEMAYAKGQRTGSTATTNLIVAILALIAGGGGTAIALAMAGR